jgi:hypothetical protein
MLCVHRRQPFACETGIAAKASKHATSLIFPHKAARLACLMNPDLPRDRTDAVGPLGEPKPFAHENGVARKATDSTNQNALR